MNYKANYINYILFVLVCINPLLYSCQKELVFAPAEPPLKPKVGTIWFYSYYTYHTNGGVYTSNTIKYEARNEQTIAGVNWLNIVEAGVDTTVYLLQEKADGLYQYTNNSANLFCKFPAVLNATYNTFNAGSAESFVVKGVLDTISTNIGNIPVYFYEGTKAGILSEQIWYNENAWIVRRFGFRKYPMGSTIFRQTGMFLRSIVY